MNKVQKKEFNTLLKLFEQVKHKKPVDVQSLGYSVPRLCTLNGYNEKLLAVCEDGRKLYRLSRDDEKFYALESSK